MKHLLRKALCVLLGVGILIGQQVYSMDEETGRSATKQARYEPLEVERPQVTDMHIGSLPWYKNRKVWVGTGLVAGVVWLTTMTWAITQDHIIAVPACPSATASPSRTNYPTPSSSPSPFPMEECLQYLKATFPTALPWDIDKIYPPSYIYASIKDTVVSTGTQELKSFCNFFGTITYTVGQPWRLFDGACCTTTVSPLTTSMRWMMNRWWNCSSIFSDDWSSVGCAADPTYTP